MVAAEEEDIDRGGLHPCDQRGVFVLAGRDGLVESDRHPALLQPPPGAIGDARSPGGPVVQDRDPVVRPMLGEVVGDLRPLLVVPAAHPEHVRAALVGQPALAEPGAICRIPASSYTLAAGIEACEHQCPPTNTTPSLASLRASATA